MPSLGEAIRCGRTGKGWTQDDLTAVLKVGKNAVWSWEVGGVLPRADSLIEIEKVFGWPRGYTLAIIAGEA